MNHRSANVFLLLVSFSIFFSSNASAKEIRVVKPEKEGVSQERLDRITHHMNQAIKDGTMIGGMGLIARNGKIIYSETYGLSDREANKAMTEDAIYHIYSMSKPITSVALMMLYEEGKFFLNDPVARYIPELADLQVAVSTADGETKTVSDGTNSATIGAGDQDKQGQTRKPKRQPTIRNLMRHTSGFSYGYFGNTEVDKQYRAVGILREKDLATFVKDLGQIPLQYEPGTRWHYSVSVDVQGRLVEVLSGMSFGEFLQKRLFEPLDMHDTSFVVPNEKLDRLTQIYSPDGIQQGSVMFFQTSKSKHLVPSSARMSAGYMEGATFEGAAAVWYPPRGII
jgi:CubicO group peptidase (beta-lactamase class C family)